MKEFSELIVCLKQKNPLVHTITNYVTVNDCANALLAVGASPIMSDEIKDVVDIVRISSALVLNIGTLNERVVESMIVAGKKANELNIPVVFDPVGAGASPYRNEVTNRILKEVKVAVIRGNLSEVSFILGLDTKTKGVDVGDFQGDSLLIAKEVSKKYNNVVVITGEIDIVADQDTSYSVYNGHQTMTKVSGTGCMLSAIVAAFVAANSDYLKAALIATILMGISGELAVKEHKGFGSLHLKIIDNLSSLTEEEIIKYGKFKRN